MNLKARYGLVRTPLVGSEYFTTVFAAPLGVAAMIDGGAEAWLDAVHDGVHDRSENYYEDNVTLLCLFAMTGNF